MASSLPRLLAAAALATAVAAGVAAASGLKEELQKRLGDEGIVGEWNYDDIDGAFARAAREKKPVCVVFR